MKYCASIESSPKVVFILIPGNPGNCELYLDFMHYLHNKYDRKVDIYSFSHLGHASPSSETYLLEDQVENSRQEIVRIKQENKDANIYLFGHSLGGYIALRLESLADKVILLFPAMDDLKNTKNAYEMWFLFTRLGLFMLAFITFITSYLPKTLRYHLIYFVEPKLTHDQAVIFNREWDPRIVYNTIGLTKDEFKIITPIDLSKFERTSRNDSSLQHKSKKLIDKFYFLFTPFDGWCDIMTYRKFATKWPNKLIERGNLGIRESGGIYLTDAQIPHAFVLGYSMEVAEILCKIIPI